MTTQKFKMMDQNMEVEIDRPPEIPTEWVEIIEKLHPITAVVVWALLNDQVSAEIISLAGYSPDIRRYESVAIVAKGNPQELESVTHQAYEELFVLFSDLLDHPRTAFIH